MTLKVLLIILNLVPVVIGRMTVDVSPGKPNQEKEVTCFVYHRFGDHRYPTTNVSVSDFEMHLNYLVKNGFQVLSFSDAIAYLKSDSPPRKTAVITIDDGYKSFFKNGFPLLKKFRLPATLFINTKTVGGGDYMGWDELKTVLKSDVEIGNHTHSHDYFLNQPASSRYKTFKDEIDLSQSIIKKNLDITPEVFSYPYGEYDPEMIKIVRGYGFKAAAAQNSGVLSDFSDLFLCPRFPMSEAYSNRAQFAEKAGAKALRLIDFSPNSYAMPNGKRPQLTVTATNSGLQLRRLQCFVQGGESKIEVLNSDDKEVRFRVQAKAAITKRRRTLYTITVPDKDGKWHWYSHLWINPDVKSAE